MAWIGTRPRDRWRAVWLAALGCGLGGLGSVAAQPSPPAAAVPLVAPAGPPAAPGQAPGGPPVAPAPAGYADPGGVVKTIHARGILTLDTSAPAGTPAPAPPGSAPVLPPPNPLPGAPPYAPDAKVLPIDLPYALRMVNASNPTIAIARLRVQEAYARLREAQVQWVPNLWVGSNPDNLTFMPNYYVHNGPLLRSRGFVFDTANSFSAFPVGTGLNLSFADALFGPRIARDLVAAEQARSRIVTYNVQLDVALTYLDLLRVYGALAIDAEALDNAQTMLNYAVQADRQGLGKTTADANRARTEVEMIRQDILDLQGQAGVVSSHLAQLLLLEPTADLVPADANILPIELVPTVAPLNDLVAVGLMNRPELAESRALVAAALARWREDRTRPLIPSLQLAYYGAQFGAGNPGEHGFAWRDDFFIQMNWQLTNGGLGNLFQARAARARYGEANLHVVEISAEVSAEVTAAAKIVRTRGQALADAQLGVQQAETMWTRLSKAAFGLATAARKYDPIEPLLAEQALRAARLQYLTEVIEYDRNQFRLFWAMGQPPLCALPRATALPVEVPVKPSPEPQAPPPPAPARGP